MSLSSSVMDMDPRPVVEPLPLWRIDSPEDTGSALWTNSKYKDFQIVVGDRVIRVHKCVLAARSPVFATMFQSGLTESQSGQLVIQDFDFETVQNVIWVLYSGRFATKYSAPVICDLLRFGHKYDIGHLINACLGQIDDLLNKYDMKSNIIIKSAEELVQISKSFQIFALEGYSKAHQSQPIISLALAKDDSFKDLKIICDDQEFFVHKCIFTLKSPVFAQMLNGNGDTSGRLTITGFKPNVVEKAVHFFYTDDGRMEIRGFYRNKDLFLGLLEFADKFRVDKLVSFCLKKIVNVKKNLDKEMVSTCLRTAAHLESKKIFDFMLAIFGTHGFDPLDFDIKKASQESYWN